MQMNIIKEIPPKLTEDDWCAIDLELFHAERSKLHLPITGIFACLTFCFNDKDVYIITDEKEVKESLNNVNDAVWIFHNAKFDITHLRRWSNVPYRKKLWDTMLIEKILWSGYYDLFSLDDLARRYLNINMDKEVRKRFNDEDVLDEEMIHYSCYDSFITRKVCESQKHLVKGKPFEIWRDVDRDALWAFLDMKPIMFNTEKWLKIAKDNEEKAKELEEQFEFNPRSPIQAKKWLSQNGFKRLRSTQEKDLNTRLNDPKQANTKAGKIAKDLLEYRKVQKRASTYGSNWVEKYVTDDYVYSNYNVIGAECLQKDQLVLTDRGYLSAENVSTEHSVITHKGKIKRVANAFCNGMKPIYNVLLSNGLSLKTTKNHPYFLSTRQWKQAGDLKIGDKIMVHSEKEEWEPIKEWGDYVISSWGRVKNINTSHVLSQHKKDKWGHLKVMLVRNNARKRGDDRKDFNVARLVAKAFIPNNTEGNEVRHINGIAFDNVINNLCWGTRLDNIKDAMNHGSMSRRNTPIAKANEQIVKVIRNTPYKRGIDGKLAEQFGLSRKTVSDIRLGKRWKRENPNRKKSVIFYPAEVINIEIKPEEITYGFTIDDDNSHITEGIVTHNTGRTSSSKPNFQNIIARGDEGAAYRECFIPHHNEVMIVIDMGQQEARINAFLSQDKHLIEILRQKDKDIFVEMAKKIYNIEITKDDPKRKVIKNIIYGMSYGMSAEGFADRYDTSLNEARKAFSDVFKTFYGLSSYIRQQKRKKDFVTTIVGRKIWLNPYSNQVERNAINSPTQGSAADQQKIAIGRIYRKWNEKFDFKFGLVGFVHDELIFSVPRGSEKEVIEFVSKEMIRSAEEQCKGVPFTVDVGVGDNWSVK